MPKTDKAAATPASRAKKADEAVRVRDIERDPGAILRRAVQKPVRIAAKDGARMFHIGTIRRGDRNDPAWAGAMPVTLAALKRRAGRILHLASALQIALRVQATAKSPDAYFIEPGSDCLEFATHRLGGARGDTALLKNAVRKSPITRAAAEIAGKQADARRQDEIKSLQGRIATLERALKKQTAMRDPGRSAIVAKNQPAPETPPSGAAESASSGSRSLVTDRLV